MNFSVFPVLYPSVYKFNEEFQLEHHFSIFGHKFWNKKSQKVASLKKHVCGELISPNNKTKN